MQNGVGNMITATAGMLTGIFSAMGAKGSSDPQHLYRDDVYVPESKVDKAPLVYAGAAALALVIAVSLLKSK